MPKENRPVQVGDWFQCGHRYDAMPDIGAEDVGPYAQQWRLWWTGLQPDCRGRGPDSLNCVCPDLPGGWSTIRRGGSNGFFVPLLALGWWFLGVKHNNGRGIDACLRALDDVVWVLENIAHIKDPVKRPHDGDAVADEIGSKRYVLSISQHSITNDESYCNCIGKSKAKADIEHQISNSF